MPIGVADAFVPFISAYRPIWLGLGAIATDLLIAVTVTSLVRARLCYRAWRLVHWAAYLCWPVAVVHGLGTGSDTMTRWVLVLTLGCVAGVTGLVAWRLAQGWPSRAGLRVAGAITLVTFLIAAGVWLMAGPLKPGWSRRAGLPALGLKVGRSGRVPRSFRERAPRSRAEPADAAARPGAPCRRAGARRLGCEPISSGTARSSVTARAGHPRRRR